MSPDVEESIVPPGEDAHEEAVWRLKERIRREDGALKQRRRSFEWAYVRQRGYLLSPADADEILAFGLIRSDGYLSLLGVSPEHRRRGLGTALVESIAGDFATITCHTRASNPGPIEFYDRMGFAVDERIENYYADGSAALHLRYGADDGDR